MAPVDGEKNDQNHRSKGEDEMKLKRVASTLILVLSITSAFNLVFAQTDSIPAQKEKSYSQRRHSIGSTFFLLGNLVPGDPPYFFLLNYGYQLARKDVIFVEAITWTYYEPLGTYGSSGEHYPGRIRAFGIGVGYKRFLWKNFYSTVQATPFLQQFFDVENIEIGNGFQLYLQSRLGYCFKFFNQRWYLEPSVAFNYWPINTNLPTSFKEVEIGTPNYFLFEPGLHFGLKF